MLIPLLSFKSVMDDMHSLTPLESKLALHHVIQSFVVVASVRVINQVYIIGGKNVGQMTRIRSATKESKDSTIATHDRRYACHDRAHERLRVYFVFRSIVDI